MDGSEVFAFGALTIEGIDMSRLNAAHADGRDVSCDAELRVRSSKSLTSNDPEGIKSTMTLNQGTYKHPFTNSEAFATWPSQGDHLSENDEFRRHLSYQAPGTGMWLFDTDAYRDWHDLPGEASLLIEGLAGTGKSVVAASVINHLQKTEPDALILYFFFRHNLSNSKRLPTSLTLTWLAKLLQHSDYCQQEFRRLSQRRPQDLTEGALWDFLLASLLPSGMVYCIVDALDQVDPRHIKTLDTRLHNIASLRPRTIKVLMTSRPRQELHSSLLVESSLHVNIEDHMWGDIKNMVHQRLHTAMPDHDLAEFRKTMAKDIVESLPVHSGGPFPYARTLVDKLTGREPVGGLERPPLTVEDLYNIMQHLVHFVPQPTIPLSDQKTPEKTKSIGWHGRRLNNGAGPKKTGSPNADDILHTQLLQGQSCFQMKDKRGVRHHLIRLFIERRYDRNIPSGKRPLLHALFENICCAISCLEIFFENVEHVNFNSRDTQGRTLLHAACNAKVLRAAYLLPGNAHVPRGDISYHATGFFLKMLDFRADAYAVDKEGRNALHILLDNPSMFEDHILTFLAKYGTRELVVQKDKRGFSALHCALRILRPKVCDILLSYGANLLDPDPDGNTALHHIARQCLRREVNGRGNIRYTTCKTSSEYLKACLSIWRKYLSLGSSVDVLDSQGLPPLYHYLTNKCEQQNSENGSKAPLSGKSKSTEEDDCMHYQHIYIFFAEANWQPIHHDVLRNALMGRPEGEEFHHKRLLKYIEKWFLK